MSIDIINNAALEMLRPAIAVVDLRQNELALSAEIHAVVVPEAPTAAADANTEEEVNMGSLFDEVVEEEWDATPLIGAIRRGDLEAVKTLSADLPNVNIQVDGMSLLYIAVFKQRDAVVEYLMSRGANINARNEEDYDSPLILARRRGDTELIRLLLTPIHRLGASSISDDFTALIESPAAPAADSTESFQECSICFCDVDPEDEMTKLVALEKCGHVCCSGCMSAFLSARMQDVTSLSLTPIIVCFARGCGAAVTFRDFERFATREASVLYQTRLTTAACRMMPEFSWCTKCESGGFVDLKQGLEDKKTSAASSSSNTCRNVSCDSCAHEYCVDCREDAHGSLTCAQKYEQIMAGDHYITERLSTRALQKFTKPCPQCAAPTIRDGGCSHMTCRACSFAWCWFCGNAYTGRYTFGNKCPCG